MIVTSEKRYIPTAVNMIVLQGKDGRYYYLHRSLYDQCVVLYDQYMSLLPSFYKMLGFETEHPSVCDTFMEEVPEPVNILGPFLGLVTGCEELDSIEEMCGALSSMSMSVDFRKMFKVPAQIRQSIKFSLSVREEYRIQWDRFFLETPEYDQVQFSLSQLSTAPAAPASEEDAYDNITFVGGEAPSLDDIMSQLNSMTASPSSEVAVEEEEGVPATTKAPSGFDMLRRM